MTSPRASRLAFFAKGSKNDDGSVVMDFLFAAVAVAVALALALGGIVVYCEAMRLCFCMTVIGVVMRCES